MGRMRRRAREDDFERIMRMQGNREEDMDILMNFEDFDELIAMRRGHIDANRGRQMRFEEVNTDQ